jgi:hypothetical protein
MRTSLSKFNKANKKKRALQELESGSGSPRSKSSVSSSKRMADVELQLTPDNAKRHKPNNEPPASPKDKVEGKDPVSPVLVTPPASGDAKEDGAPALGDSVPVVKPAIPPNSPIQDKPEEKQVEEGDNKEAKSDNVEVPIPRADPAPGDGKDEEAADKKEDSSVASTVQLEPPIKAAQKRKAGEARLKRVRKKKRRRTKPKEVPDDDVDPIDIGNSLRIQ